MCVCVSKNIILPSFGSQHICSYSNLSQATDRSIVPPPRGRVSYLSATRTPSLSLHREYACDPLQTVPASVREQNFVLHPVVTSRQGRPSLVARIAIPRTRANHSQGVSSEEPHIPERLIRPEPMLTHSLHKDTPTTPSLPPRAVVNARRGQAGGG